MRMARIIWVLAAVVAIGIALFAYSYARGKSAIHSATLRWSPSPCATSYNVYRATMSRGPYSKIGAASTPRYVDAPVSSGSVFYYVVTAVCKGKESGYSQEIKAAIP